MFSLVLVLKAIMIYRDGNSVKSYLNFNICRSALLIKIFKSGYMKH